MPDSTLDRNGQRLGLGDEARDVITGFTGIVTGIGEHVTGCDAVNLQPQETTKTGAQIKPLHLDVTRVERVRQAVVPCPPVVPSPARIGDIARDRITRMQGIVILKMSWIYGFETVRIQPVGFDTDGQPLDTVSVEGTMIEFVESTHLTRGPAASAEKPASPEKPKGGPRDQRNASTGR